MPPAPPPARSSPRSPDPRGFRAALESLALPRFGTEVRSRSFIVALEGPNGAGKSHSVRRA